MVFALACIDPLSRWRVGPSRFYSVLTSVLFRLQYFFQRHAVKVENCQELPGALKMMSMSCKKIPGCFAGLLTLFVGVALGPIRQGVSLEPLTRWILGSSRLSSVVIRF